MAELVDAQDLGSCDESCGGSSPFTRTIHIKYIRLLKTDLKWVIMKIIENNKEGLKVKLTISIDWQEIENKTNHKLQDIAKTAHIKGFRRGKVPLNVIENKYKLAASQESLDELIKECTHKIFHDENITPASEPKLDVVTFEEGKDFVYKVEVELMPKFDLPEIKNIELDKYNVEINDADIIEELELLSTNDMKYTLVKQGKSTKEDAIRINAKGKVDGEYFPGGVLDNTLVVLSEKVFIDNFEEQLLNLKAGDKTIVKVKFPDNYFQDNLAGKNSEFEVEVVEVLEKKIPELNDDFAKNFKLNSITELKDNIKSALNKELSIIAYSLQKKYLFDKLENIVEFDVPESMLKRELDLLKGKAETFKRENKNFNLGKTEEELEQELKKLAKRRTKLGILLSEIAKANNITVTHEDIRQTILDQPSHIRSNILEMYKTNPKILEMISGQALEYKAVAFLIEKSTNTLKTLSKDELIKKYEAIEEESLL